MRKATKDVFKRILFWFVMVGLIEAVWHWIWEGVKFLAGVISNG